MGDTIMLARFMIWADTFASLSLLLFSMMLFDLEVVALTCSLNGRRLSDDDEDVDDANEVMLCRLLLLLVLEVYDGRVNKGGKGLGRGTPVGVPGRGALL